MKRIDKLTDVNFRIICQSPSHSGYWVYFENEYGETLPENEQKEVAEYMAENGLIKINDENCHLSLNSENICEKGWIEYLKLKAALPEPSYFSFDKNTIDFLERLKDGKTIILTKDSPDEIRELITNLKNFGILHKPTKIGYASDFKNRKHLTKLIELKSWPEFLNWLDGQNSDSSIVNDFSGSTIGQVNQSTEKINVKSPIKQKTTPKIAKEPKKKSWIEIFAWIVGIISGVAALYEFVIKNLIN